MPVIENFIRHGKQARTTESPSAAQTTFQSPDAYTNTQARDVQSKLIAEKAAQDKAQASTSQGKNAADPVLNEAAARIVAEEKEAKGKLPSYPGLEKYKLILKMGDGAFSNVYKAQDRETGQIVAVKVVRKYELSSSQGNAHLHPNIKKKAPKGIERANILKEVQIMRNLDHPNVVKLLEFLESRDYYFLVLELCSGGELFHQIVRLTYFSENLSRHVITQVAKSIHYLHEVKGVVHRDIKPENLLFEPIDFIPTREPIIRSGEDEDKEDEGEFISGKGSGGIGVVKIADFGLSKVVWDTQTMTPCGTVGYTAPEIVKDERYSKSVDMWALGCVLYTLLCGFPPFYDESIQVLTEKVARGQYTFLSPWWDEISKSAQDLISHLLTVDPDQRYTIDDFLAHPWIRETTEETQPASDAPPTGVSAQTPMELMETFPAQTPGGRFAVPQTPGGTRRDFRSPGLVALREVFDVTYAVHRQEEEGARKKNVKHANYRLADLNSMDEDEEDEYHAGIAADKRKSVNTVEDVTGSLQSTSLGEKKRRVEADTRRAPQTSRKKGFELNMDNATLLGRRGKGPTVGA